jgi:autotransporter passenger strand-loop-strand repeat protein
MNGGTATGTTISGGKQEVFAGGTAIGTTINSAGQMPPTTNLQDVNGTAIGTTINSRGLQAVEPGGTAISTTIIGGQQNVFSGAATSTTISGGEQLVEFFGTATSTTISGGEQVVETGGIAISTIVSSGGSEIVSSGSTAIGTTISDATEYVSSGGTAIGVIFAGASGTLDLVRPQGLSGTISGWQVGDVLDFVSTNLASVGISGSQLSVTVSGGTTFVYQLAGQEANTSASIQSDGAGGSDVVLSSVPQNISKGHTLIVSHGQPRLRWRRKLIVASGGTADPVTINSGGIEVSGQLRIADAAGSSTVFSGTISGFGGASHANKKQSIDLVDVAFTSGAITSRYVSSGGNTTGTLFVSSGGTEVAAINFVGSYTAANFHISSGGVGVIITDPGVVNGGVVTDGLAQAFPNQGIDLPNIAFSAHTTLAYAENAAGTGGTLTVSDGRHAASIALLGNYIAGSFAAAPDGHGGTLVTQLQPQQQPLLTHPQA